MTEELQTTGNQYLDLIRQVVTNPDVPVEKIKALMDMQLLLEDRQAEKEFDAAMIDAQAEIEGLNWDKKGDNNRYVSYPKIDKMLRPIRKKHGFTQSYDIEPGPSPDLATLCCDVSHVGGHRRRYRAPMPIDGQGPKGGGVMTKPQAVNAGTSYGMRNLAKMIWNIPMLVDKDDNDGAGEYEKVTADQVANLTALAEETKKSGETAKKVITNLCKYYKVDKLENLPASQYSSAVAEFERKRKAA